MSLLTLFAQSSLSYGDPAYLDSYVATTEYNFTNIILVGIIAVAIAYIVGAFLLGKIFKKANVAAWKAWVPVYNSWTLFELGGQKGIWAVLALVPIINIIPSIFMIIAMHSIGRKLGKSDTFVLLAIFLPLAWMVWLAVDDSTWKGAALPGARSGMH